MEMSPGQRKAVFALIVLALAGLGVYLVVPGAHGAGAPHADPSSPAAPRSHPAANTPSAAVAGAGPAPATGATPDIYQWLPFSESDLGSAAAVVTRFSRDYGTWSYTQNATEYVATMNGLVTQELSQFVAEGYSESAVANERTTDKQVSAGTAVINQLRTFGASSMTFVVTISQQITSTGGTSNVSGQYAVTVASSGSVWQVSDIELASAGNS